MSWRFLLSLVLTLAYFGWILKGCKAYSRFGIILFLVGSTGALIHLSCAYVRTLPARAPLRTIIGLATNRSVGFFDRHHSQFLLIEYKTDDRFLFATEIDGPWSDEPIRATYVDDGRFMPSVVRIEILSSDQFPWKVEKRHAGWGGNR